MRLLNLLGERFGMLLVVSMADRVNGRTRWRCICDCGNIGEYMTANLRIGDTKSCGCYQKDHPGNLNHGHNRPGKRTKTYGIWAGMRSRCNNKSHKDYRFYGAKGIKVCARWDVFSNFLEDMGEAVGDMTIDRIDSSKGYEKSNCQWLSHSENTRKATALRLGYEYKPRCTPATPKQFEDVPA